MFAAALYVAHCWFGGGSTNIISDSYGYLARARGHTVGVPYDTRILQPFLARLVSSVSGLYEVTAFELLTPIELLASLILIAGMLRRRGADIFWQAAITLAFGCGVAVTFGYTPVLLDPLTLLLACLMITALDRNYLTLALIVACLSALNKEYGAVLGFIWAWHAYHRGYRAYAVMGALLPALALIVAMLAIAGDTMRGFSSWQNFTGGMFGYHLMLLRNRGPYDYPKILYMWFWVTMWPLFVISLLEILRQLRNRAGIKEDQFGFIIMLAALPVLLLGDFGRTLLIAVPFACIAATSLPLARNTLFASLLAIGGVATALARPFHGDFDVPKALTLAATFISATASVLLLTKIIRSYLRNRAAKTGQKAIVYGASAN